MEPVKAERFRTLAAKYQNFLTQNMVVRMHLMLECSLAEAKPDETFLKGLATSFLTDVQSLLGREFFPGLMKLVEAAGSEPEDILKNLDREALIRHCEAAAKNAKALTSAALARCSKRGQGLALDEEGREALLETLRAQFLGEVRAALTGLMSVLHPEFAVRLWSAPERGGEYKVTDILGRFMFMPVESVYEIGADDVPKNRSEMRFSRIFCLPILQNLKFHIIGESKYESYNDYYYNLIRKFFPDAQAITKANVDSFFANQKLKETFSVFLLQILRKYETPFQRENFIQRVNKLLKESRGNADILFNQTDMDILFQGWSLFILDNRDFSTLRSTDVDLLSTFVPDRVAQFKRQALLAPADD